MDDAKTDTAVTRRDFMRTAALSAGAAALASGTNFAHAAGSDRIRIGLIGCGGRGTGAAFDCLTASPSIELYAMADVFEDRLNGSYRRHQGKGKNQQFNITPERLFVGFDAYRKLLETDVDLVLMATPPALPARTPPCHDRGRQACVHRETGRGRPGRRAQGHRRV